MSKHKKHPLSRKKIAKINRFEYMCFGKTLSNKERKENNKLREDTMLELLEVIKEINQDIYEEMRRDKNHSYWLFMTLELIDKNPKGKEETKEVIKNWAKFVQRGYHNERKYE